MAAHRYWRIRSVCNFGGQIGFNEIEFANTAGGANLCTGGTAITNTTYGGFYAAAKAFDGNLTDGSVYAGADKYGWIGYDRGAGNDVEINEVRIAPYSDIFDTCPRVLVLESSDDSVTWTIEYWIVTYMFVVYNTLTAFTRPPVQSSYQHWGLFNNEGAGGLGYRDMVIVEMELRGSVGGADLTGSGTATASAFNGSGFDPFRAFDNNNGTLFYSGYPIPPTQYLAYDFGAGNDEEIGEVSIRGDPGAGNLNRAPGIGFIGASIDGKAWTKIGDYAGLDYSVGDTDTFAVAGGGPPPAPARRRSMMVVN